MSAIAPPVPTSVGTAEAKETEPRGTRYRPELEGLRAVAILLVAASHLWWGRISGGIDVFLVVSGYLITVTLVQRWARTGRVGAGRFVSRLVSRLFPAAFLVFAVVAAVAVQVAAQGRPALASDVLTALGYAAGFGENWYLALATEGYLSPDRALNPVEHFWALSMQVQFYLIWLVLVAVLALVARRRRTAASRRRLAVTAIAAVATASLAWSVAETIANQPVAYLDTSARIWEFAAGGLLALLADRLRVGPRLGAFVGWIGLALVVGLGFAGRFDDWFPGIASLVPVLGTALVVAGANGGSRWGVERVLGSRIGVLLGGLAFGLYLWHWPLLSAAAILWDHVSWGALDGLALVAVALGLSWLTKHLVEGPFQRIARASPAWERRGVASGVALSLIVALAAPSAVAQLRGPESARAVAEASAKQAALDPEVFPSVRAAQDALRAALAEPGPPTVAEEANETSLADVMRNGCLNAPLAQLDDCTFGSPHARRALVIGDSSAASWMPTVVGALGSDWQVRLFARGSCPFITSGVLQIGLIPGTDQQCVAQDADARSLIADWRPELIVVSGSARSVDRLSSGATGDAAITEWRAATLRTARELRATGAEVLLLQAPPIGQTQCGASDFADGGTRCATEPTPNWYAVQGIDEQVARATGALSIDTEDWFCVDAACPWGVDGTLVRGDGIHLTERYGERLAKLLRLALGAQAPALLDGDELG